jgi:hypothetical protein
MLAPYVACVLGLDEASSLLPFTMNGDHGYCSDRCIDGLLAALDQPELSPQVVAINPGLPESLWVPATLRAVDMLVGIAGLMGVAVCATSGDYVTEG